MKIFVTDYGFANTQPERAIAEMAGFELEAVQCRTSAEVITHCREADALIVQWAPVDRTAIAALEKCRVIVRYGIGVDNLDLAAAAERGIPVCNVPDYCIEEVADHSLSLALALARQLPQTDAALRSGTWSITPPGEVPAFRDTVFATAGFGRIARAVLDRARPFGFQLAAYDPFVDPAIMEKAGVRPLDQDDLFRESGILSLHLPLTAKTKHFVSAERLREMKRSAVLVNTARGALIDTHALAEGLNEGVIAGAGLDVYETEPLSADHPLRQSRNALLTSHTAWFSNRSVPELQRRAAEEAVRALKGEKLRNVVNGVLGR